MRLNRSKISRDPFEYFVNVGNLDRNYLLPSQCNRKKRCSIFHDFCTILQIFSVTLFEEMRISLTFQGMGVLSNPNQYCNQLPFKLRVPIGFFLYLAVSLVMKFLVEHDPKMSYICGLCSDDTLTYRKNVVFFFLGHAQPGKQRCFSHYLRKMR